MWCISLKCSFLRVWGFFVKNKFNCSFPVRISNMTLLNTSNKGSVSRFLGWLQLLIPWNVLSVATVSFLNHCVSPDVADLSDHLFRFTFLSFVGYIVY